MIERVERRKVWSRIVGVERRAAPLHDLDGRPLPDPTRLEDEEFTEARAKLDEEKRKALADLERRGSPGRFD